MRPSEASIAISIVEIQGERLLIARPFHILENRMSNSNEWIHTWNLRIEKDSFIFTLSRRYLTILLLTLSKTVKLTKPQKQHDTTFTKMNGC